MSDYRRRGRPSKRDTQQRTLRFAELVARDGGATLRESARKAGIDPWRALDLLSEDSFRRVVEALMEREDA